MCAAFTNRTYIFLLHRFIHILSELQARPSTRISLARSQAEGEPRSTMAMPNSSGWGGEGRIWHSVRIMGAGAGFAHPEPAAAGPDGDGGSKAGALLTPLNPCWRRRIEQRRRERGGK